METPCKQNERHKMLKHKEGQKEQIFTKPEILKDFADLIAEKMGPEDCFIDCSCGTGGLGIELIAKGKRVIMFDIDDSFLLEEARPFFVKKDWLTVAKKDIPGAATYVLGFNPPYGYHNKLSKQFILHGLTLELEHKCKWMFFLTMYLGDVWHPKNYVLESRTTYQSHKIFYNPCVENYRIPDFYGVTLTVFKWSDEEFVPAIPSQPLPEGWSMFRTHEKGEVRIPYKEMRLLEREHGKGRVLLLKSTGLDAGQAGRWWDRRTRRYIFYNKLNREKIEPEQTFSISQHLTLVVPERYAFDKRKIVVSKLNPVLFNLRQEKGRKQGVSVKEITWAINQIEW